MIFIKFILINFCLCYLIATARPLKKMREAISRKSLQAGEFIGCCKCLGLWTSPFVYLYEYKIISVDMIGYCLMASVIAGILQDFKRKYI